MPERIKNRDAKIIRTFSTLNLSLSVGWLPFLKQISPRGSLLFLWKLGGHRGLSYRLQMRCPTGAL